MHVEQWFSAIPDPGPNLNLHPEENGEIITLGQDQESRKKWKN